LITRHCEGKHGRHNIRCRCHATCANRLTLCRHAGAADSLASHWKGEPVARRGRKDCGLKANLMARQLKDA
jgi:hypothetical protein